MATGKLSRILHQVSVKHWVQPLWLEQSQNSCLHVNPVLIFNLGGKRLCLYLGQRIHSAQYLALLVHPDLDLKVASTAIDKRKQGPR